MVYERTLFLKSWFYHDNVLSEKENMMLLFPTQYLTRREKNMAILLLYLNPMEFAASGIQVWALILKLASFNWVLLHTWHLPTSEPPICKLCLPFTLQGHSGPCKHGCRLAGHSFSTSLDTADVWVLQFLHFSFGSLQASLPPPAAHHGFSQALIVRWEGWCLSFAFQIETNRI